MRAGAAPVAHAWFGDVAELVAGDVIPLSPAILILVFPGAFRFTCYYYRKAYYRSFAGSPPGCAVGPLAGKRTYRGETALLLFQNLHRYALYFALALHLPARQGRGRVVLPATASSASASAASSSRSTSS